MIRLTEFSVSFFSEWQVQKSSQNSQVVHLKVVLSSTPPSRMRVRGEDMRLKQQLTLIILITILTLTGPVQAVTASQLANHDDGNTTTKMRLPNEGRSDLQELIQRVDANVGEPSSEEPSSEPEVDEPETVEGPV